MEPVSSEDLIHRIERYGMDGVTSTEVTQCLKNLERELKWWCREFKLVAGPGAWNTAVNKCVDYMDRPADSADERCVQCGKQIQMPAMSLVCEACQRENHEKYTREHPQESIVKDSVSAEGCAHEYDIPPVGGKSQCKKCGAYR